MVKQVPEKVEEAKEIIPTGEFATPEDQGNAAVFLCSNLARQINGATLPVDGGYTVGKR